MVLGTRPGGTRAGDTRAGGDRDKGDSATAEVLIAGGGPAGAALALGLLAAGLDRVAIAPGPPPKVPFRIGESASPGVAPALARLGLEADLSRLGHLPCRGNLSAWGTADPVFDDFMRRGTGSGWHLDRARFDAWLLDQARHRGALVLSGATVETISAAAGGWRVWLQSGEELRARVVADCTGRRGAVASRLGARRRRIDRLQAVAILIPAPARADSDQTLGDFSLVEAVPDGWWYAARIPGDRFVVALMADPDTIVARRLHRPGGFLAAWAETCLLRDRVPPPQPEASGSSAGLAGLTVFPGATQHLDQACGPGWIAAGDALIGMDPLSAAGIDGAFSDADAAAATIVSWLGASRFADCLEAAETYRARADHSLRRYLTERRAIYRREQRWPDHPFWRRRTGPLP